LVEAALLLDIVVLLVLVRTYLPIPGFQGVLRLVCPAPFVLLALRRGTRTCLVATVAAYVLLSTLIGPILAIQILVFGALGAIFGYVSSRRGPAVLAIVIGAAVYGVLYLFVPFVLGLLVLRISPQGAIDAVRTQVHSIVNFILSLRFGGLSLRDTPVRGVTNLAEWFVAHWLVAIVVGIVLYSLLNIWAYLIVTRELFRLLPADVRTDAQGATVDFYT
jgi:uncharacterized protein YybS (DUF2232 family)